MEQSPSQQPPSLTPATSSSDEAEYWCYHCDTTALVKTLVNCSQIVCCECNSGFVESISSIAVSVSPDHFNASQILGLFADSVIGEDGNVDDDEFAEENDGESEESGDIYDENEEECVIDSVIEENDEDDDEIEEDGESDDEYGEMDDDDDEGEEEEEDEQNIENVYNTRETLISEFRLHLGNSRNAVRRLAAILSDYDLERMSLEDETDGDERTGAPPAAESVVSSLKTVDVEVENDVIHCAVCKDLVSVGEVTKELGCGHGYHEECILPWLGLRNTCPVCRFELPTDDADYEEKRKKKSVGASASGGAVICSYFSFENISSVFFFLDNSYVGFSWEAEDL